jgi:vitamin B12/bleomycin/antimicrobial peptide transport system ATP-binding/permease protein
MPQTVRSSSTHKALVQRFWIAARGFWSGEARLKAWTLSIGLVVLVLTQIGVQYRLNLWTRDVFNAVEQRSAADLLHQALVLLPLTIITVALAVTAVYGRMTMQREWRAWFTNFLIERWVAHGRYYQLNLIKGDHQVPEARISDDARTATDAPVDFAVSIFQSIITMATFIGVLWYVGGGLTITLWGSQMFIPAYLVIAAVIYSIVVTAVMGFVGRRFTATSAAVNQAEAEFRYALTRVRENGESIALLGGEPEERNGLHTWLGNVLGTWRKLLHQHMRLTVVSNTNYQFAPAIPIFLCMPKYLAGTMSLGEVTQLAAAFVSVQSAFNWLVDNFGRYSDWKASVRRVGSLMTSLDHLDALEKPGVIGAIIRSEQEGTMLRLHNLTVTLDDGTVVINDADVAIGKREKVLLIGESGTGKSTLVRAIAGLWPWGGGEIVIQKGAKLFFMPQRPYIPLGTLRRVATYPLAADMVDDATLRDLMDATGIGYLAERLDSDEPWDQVLSGGEKQRLAFVRLFLHQPDIVIMDEATSSLDPTTQEELMNMAMDQLAETAILSVSHRPELEAFHDRRLSFEHRPGGSRLVGDVVLIPAPRRPSRLRSRILNIVRPKKLQ